MRRVLDVVSTSNALIRPVNARATATTRIIRRAIAAVVMAVSEYSAALIREIVTGRLDVEDNRLDPHAGRTDPKLARVLSYRKNAWDRFGSGQYRETERYAEVVGTVETARVSDSIAGNPESVIAATTGVVERDVSVEHVTELSALYGLVRNPGSILNFAGGTDNGKTNVVWLAVGTKVDVEPETLIIGNIRESGLTLPETWDYAEAQSIDQVESRMEMEPKRPKIVVVDDASIDHSAHASSGEVEKRQGRLVRLAAKLHAAVIYVGHRSDGKDLAKHVRSMPGTRHVLANRIDNDDGTTDRFVAAVYDDLDDERGLTDHYVTLDPLPEARPDYDPDTIAHNLFEK